MKDPADTENNRWYKYAKVYDPIKCASIDGTDCEPHDRAVIRALNSEYRPNRFIKGQPECTIFISRLNHDTSKDTIKEVFSNFGKIKRFRLVRDIVTGMPKGYGFIEYEEEQSAEEAYRSANRMLIDGKPVFVDFECERLLSGWKPRRLGGGFGGKKESGQLRFGGRDRPFKKPVALELEGKRKKEEADRKRDKERRVREKDRKDYREKSRDRKRTRSGGRENGVGSPVKKKVKESSPLLVKRPSSPKDKPKLIEKKDTEKEKKSAKKAEEQKPAQKKDSREKDIKPDIGRNSKSSTIGDGETRQKDTSKKNPSRPSRNIDRRSPEGLRKPSTKIQRPKSQDKRPQEQANNHHRKSPVAQQRLSPPDRKPRHHSPAHRDKRAEEPVKIRHAQSPTRKQTEPRAKHHSPPRHYPRISSPRADRRHSPGKESDRRRLSPQTRKHHSPKRHSPGRQGGVASAWRPHSPERVFQRSRSPINRRKPTILRSEDRKYEHLARAPPHRPPSPSYRDLPGRAASPPRKPHRSEFPRQDHSEYSSRYRRISPSTERYNVSQTNDEQQYYYGNIPRDNRASNANFPPSSLDFHHPPPAYHPVYSDRPPPESIARYPPPTREFFNYCNQQEFGAVRESFSQREESHKIRGYSPSRLQYDNYGISTARGRTFESSRDVPEGGRGSRRQY